MHQTVDNYLKKKFSKPAFRLYEVMQPQDYNSHFGCKLFWIESNDMSFIDFCA